MTPREAKAVQRALGDHVVLTAPKSALGHTVGAAGAVESIVTLLSIRDGIIPATLNLEKLDPGVELDVVTGEPRKVDIDAAVSATRSASADTTSRWRSRRSDRVRGPSPGPRTVGVASAHLVEPRDGAPSPASR